MDNPVILFGIALYYYVLMGALIGLIQAWHEYRTNLNIKYGDFFGLIVFGMAAWLIIVFYWIDKFFKMKMHK